MRSREGHEHTGGSRRSRGWVRVGGAGAAVLAATGTYASIAAQTGHMTLPHALWTILAAIIAAIFAYLTAAAGGFALLARSDSHQSPHSVGFGHSQIWGGVPPRNPVFTNRRDALDLIRRLLSFKAANHTVVVRSCALHGLGGVGKSSLAAEYAHRYRDQYRLVWWIRSEQGVSIADDMARLLGALVGASDLDRADIFTHLRRELPMWQPWLLIFDNSKDPVAIREAWPDGGIGHVIVTSRSAAWADLIDETIAVDVLSQNDAVMLLHRQTRSEDPESAAEIADNLGRLPLALMQAAAYVTQTETSLAHYAQLVEDRLDELIKVTAPADYSLPVATTWSMSIAEAEAEAPGSRQLLIFCSYLAPEAIPRSLLRDCARWLPSPLSKMGADQLTYDLAVAALRRYSLIIADSGTLSLHRLVQFTMRESLSEDDQRAQWPCFK